ncbi:MAG: transposase [Acidobacteriota bacterium]|nr:transposase [Acidobacteriota bacterium]
MFFITSLSGAWTGSECSFSDGDRKAYLALIRANLADASVSVQAWRLMNNHVHWMVKPEREDSLAVLFRRVHGRYAQYLNARRGRSGHLWQNRYFACAVEGGHCGNALRYIEMNPVRAGIAAEPASYRWSSARQHLGGPDSGGALPGLDWSIWREFGEVSGWRELLGWEETMTEVVAFRRCTYAGKPYGTAEFVLEMEKRFGRKWRTPGRPRKPVGSITGTEWTASVSAI